MFYEDRFDGARVMQNLKARTFDPIFLLTQGELGALPSNSRSLSVLSNLVSKIKSDKPKDLPSTIFTAASVGLHFCIAPFML